MHSFTPNFNKDKAVMFFSASSVKDSELLYDFGVRDILVSYHYISKSFSFYDKLLPDIKKDGGLFMTDSGGFSFLGSIDLEHTPEASTEKYWLPYLEKYVGWLIEHKDYIFVAANLDLDRIVGREIVDKWNEKYFKPLEEHMNIVYVAHKDYDNVYNDKTGMKRLREYCSLHKYVGVNQGWKDIYKKVYECAKIYGTIIHGFAWTSIPLLKSAPFFSVDSTTWLGGVRYGTSYNDDGKNFRVNDYKKKFIRKGDKVLCEKWGVNYHDLLAEKREAINKYNLIGWMGARREYIRSANTKLKNKPVSFYDKRKQHGKKGT